MKRKQIILLSIILFPSLLYFAFELTQANFKKMAYYGPKTVNEKGDTVYYSVPNISFREKLVIKTDTLNNGTGCFSIEAPPFEIDITRFPVYIILFLNDSLKRDGYKLESLFDYSQYKPNEFKNIPMFFISDWNSIKNDTMHFGIKQLGTFDSLKINLPNFHPLLSDYISSHNNFSFYEEKYFKKKPKNVSNYFAVLVDKQRHIRGYYDPNQNSEIKRMVQEYKHLKTKDEYAKTLEKNEIEKK